VSGTVEYSGVYYKYEGRERDWYFPDITIEETKAMGRLFEIKDLKLGLVAGGRTLKSAETALVRSIALYFTRGCRKL